MRNKNNKKSPWKPLISQLLKTLVIPLSAIAVITIGSIAWFASNRQVQAEIASISSKSESFRLATTGVRQSAELHFLNLNQGSKLTYKNTTYYCSDGDAIAMRLSRDDAAVFPGASGSISFYIVPSQDGTLTATLYLGLTGYVTDEESATITPLNDPVLDSLLSGHILLFGSHTGNRYSNWLFSPSDAGIMDNAITISLPAETQKDVPIPVTIYWIWPRRYETMLRDIYPENSSEYKDVFAPFLEEQADPSTMTPINDTQYRYSRLFLSEEELNTKYARTKAFDLADEYIGTNANYLYLTIQTSATFEGSGKEQS